MKKTIVLLLVLLSTTALYSEPYFSGELTLVDTTTLFRVSDLNINNNAKANIKLNMDVKSNGVKFYLEGLLNNYVNNKSLKPLLNKAYIKYRLPYKESYMNFQIGKSYYAMGGGLIYNAGNPMLDDSYALSTSSTIPTFWNGVITLPLYQGDDFDTLYLGFFGVLPIEDDSSKAGAFFNYEIGNKYFDNMELSILTDLDSTKLCFGYDGTLYFDYGIYGKIDLQSTDDFDFSLFLTKVYDKLTFNCEALYKNESNLLQSTPTLSYAASDKLSVSVSYLSTVAFNDEVSYSNTLSGTLTFSIVQGFKVYSAINSSFIDTNLASVSFGTNYTF